MPEAGNQSPETTDAKLRPVALPAGFNYIGVFLTFACNLRCSYCINRFGDLQPVRRLMTGSEWVRGLNRIVSRPDLPITLQGGEPTLHPDIYSIIAGVRPELNIDILTNIEFDVVDFMEQVAPDRLKREAPYASIRVSFHPETVRIEALAAKVLTLQNAGYSIGIWGVEHPMHTREIAGAREYCISRGIDFRTKDFLGEHGGVLHGRYKYPKACDRSAKKKVACRPSELLISPEGDIYRCHGDLYEGRGPVGHILDPELVVSPDFRECSYFGYCNPCDVKMKTDRFQKFGHTSVEVRFLE